MCAVGRRKEQIFDITETKQSNPRKFYLHISNEILTSIKQYGKTEV